MQRIRVDLPEPEVHHERDLGVLADVGQTLEPRSGGPFGFLVDGEIQVVAVEHIADGHDVGPSGAIRRGEPGDPLRI